MSGLPASFHPLIQSWFTETYGEPTAVQAEAWPLIEQGNHVLALAPTGSGKTLTAFLSAISRFCSDTAADVAYQADQLTVLYVSPLKALNEDIKRNLLEPLAAIRCCFEQAGLLFPAIRVQTRSGDTPQSERRRFLSHPPSILALTPESLAILLLNPRGRQALSTVKYLIMDEIHAVLGNKRGAFLSCQIDRLSLVAGEFQRISLSATIRSPEIAAEFIGGIDSLGKNRTVHIAAPAAEKQIDFSIEYPDVENEIEQIDKYGKRYTGLINYILNRISEHSTILIFTDSRRRAERLCFFLNQEAAGKFNGPVAFTHHGSLSKELRQSVERRLAEGSLPCVVATASLELGIDIGSVDEVVLAGSPGSIAQALQRIGRSGHGVGKVSRGRLFPFHGMDLLLAVALKGAVDERDIEEIHPVENPLDILAQIILALCVEKTWNIEELYTLLRRFYVFKTLNRDSYIRTVNMLAGLGKNTRLREVKPRIWLDKITDEIGALEGALLLLYSSGGVIANRGQYSLRLADGTKIGELDEEFVWERRMGDRFHFGGRHWRIIGIGAESVEVAPLDTATDAMPFWHADTAFRSSLLTGRVLALLDHYNAAGNLASLRREEQGSGRTDAAAVALEAFLDSQRSVQGDLPLPGSSGMTVELIDSPESQGDFFSVVIHSFRGGEINYPLGLALAQELEEMLNLRVESFSNDDALLFLIPRVDMTEGVYEEMFRRALVSLNATDSGALCRGERLFRNRLETSGVFGANFREAAERSLLLPKAGFGKRTPLWIMRQRSKRLFDAVSAEDGFPVTAEAWRSCLRDMFDMEGFRELLGAISDGSVTLSFFRSSIPSPFSRDMVRQETNSLIYEYDERRDMLSAVGGHSATLSDRVIEEALGNAALRPVLTRELVDGFTARLRREISGWAPEDDLSLCEWVKERIAIPLDEWEILTAALPENLRQKLSAERTGGPYCNERLKMIKREGAAVASVVHREWESVWEREALTLLGPWLRYEGPVSLSRIAEVFGASAANAADAVNALVEVEEIAGDVEIADNTFICDRENLDMLLRLSRRKARPVIREQSAVMLVPFLAHRQGLAVSSNAAVSSHNASCSVTLLEKLVAWASPAKLWETEFCTARDSNYNPETIDREIREGRLVWYGAGKERISLCRPDDLDLVLSDAKRPHTAPVSTQEQAFAQAINSGFFDRPRDFWEIKEEVAVASAVYMQIANTRPDNMLTANTAELARQDLSAKDCIKELWREAWAGRISSDSLEPIRRGIEAGFAPKDNESVEQSAGQSLGQNAPGQTFTGKAAFAPRPPRIPRALRDRWKEGAPVRGRWFSLAIDEPENAASDPLDEECRNKDRVRLLLARWGILCRPLLEHEAAPFTWSGLLPTIRRMELAGELIAGRFFAGINSLQFASPAIIRELENAEAAFASPPDSIYWMNAADPASPAGLEIEGLDPRIPARLSSSRLYFRREQLVAVSNRGGKELYIFISPNDSGIAVLIDLIKIPRTRKVLPEGKILVEKINDIDASQSEYAVEFQTAGFVPDRNRLCFW
ncbi:MAG: DEAD/DEAH box helicase [Treponema sp.]|jgi:ATP-dependent Lhr-like helicase|nr:DEAD/DEAH box helicase [Treponema sp.]